MLVLISKLKVKGKFVYKYVCDDCFELLVGRRRGLECPECIDKMNMDYAKRHPIGKRV